MRLFGWIQSKLTKIILATLTALSAWAILSIQFHVIPVIKISLEEETVTALNSFLLTLAYSFIAALVFYLVTTTLPARQRRDKIDPVVKKKIDSIGRCIRDILLEFHRKTNHNYDVHDTTTTEVLLKSKDWFANVPMLQQYQNVQITYLKYMVVCGENMKKQISDLITKYHTEMTAAQLVELENLAESQFFHTVEFICSMHKNTIADSGYDSLIKDFIELQNQYMKVEKEFDIHYE